MGFRTIATGLALLSTTGWAQYVLEDDYMQGNFFDKFSFWDSTDPTNGFVQYQSYANAQAQSLISSSPGSIEMRIADTGITPNGRASVRISSTQTYNSGLVIVDVEHMPGGICGTWPAFWMLGPDWPNGGEIDIIEGVNNDNTNKMTLHTNAGCTVNSNSGFTGSLDTSNCDINALGQGYNVGCGVDTTNTQTYGTGFNQNGGGVYATEITSTYIAVYFFPRNAIPSDVSSDSPNPANWGTPMAKFQGDCDIPAKFSDMQIVFTSTLCGDWAGNVWSQSSCSSQAATCNDFVANNPSAFTDAYWKINALKVFSVGSGPSPPQSSSPPNPISSPAGVSTPVPPPISIPATSSPTTFATSPSIPTFSQPSSPPYTVTVPGPIPSDTPPWVPIVTGPGAISGAEPTDFNESPNSPNETPTTSCTDPAQSWDGSNAAWPTNWLATEHSDPGPQSGAWDVGFHAHGHGSGGRAQAARHLRFHRGGHGRRHF